MGFMSTRNVKQTPPCCETADVAFSRPGQNSFALVSNCSSDSSVNKSCDGFHFMKKISKFFMVESIVAHVCMLTDFPEVSGSSSTYSSKNEMHNPSGTGITAQVFPIRPATPGAVHFRSHAAPVLAVGAHWGSRYHEFEAVPLRSHIGHRKFQPLSFFKSLWHHIASHDKALYTQKKNNASS